MAAKLDVSYAPKGNWVARNLRLINDSSKELFPKTPAEAKAGRFHTMYKEDFHEFPTEVLLEGLAAKVSGGLPVLVLLTKTGYGGVCGSDVCRCF